MTKRVRITIIVEPEDIHVYGQDRLEIDVPAEAETLKAQLAAKFTNALAAMERAMTAKPSVEE